MQTAVKDQEYKEIVSHSALTLADGTGLIWALRFLGKPIQERITGIDFLLQLCRTASAEEWPVYLLGGKPDIADQAAKKLQALYPGLKVAGVQHGYFSAAEEKRIIEEIRQNGTRLLFVGMGIPRQEKWIHAHRQELGDLVAIGVGGSFDVISGTFPCSSLYSKSRSGMVISPYSGTLALEKGPGPLCFCCQGFANETGYSEEVAAH